MRRGKEIAAALGLVSALKGVPAHAEDQTVAMAGRATMETRGRSAELKPGEFRTAGDSDTSALVEAAAEKQESEKLAAVVKKLAGTKVPSGTWQGHAMVVGLEDRNKRFYTEAQIAVYNGTELVVGRGEDRLNNLPAALNVQPLFSLERLPQVSVEFVGLIKNPSVALQEEVKHLAKNRDMKKPVVSFTADVGGAKNAGIKVVLSDASTKQEYSFFIAQPLVTKMASADVDHFLVGKLYKMVTE